MSSPSILDKSAVRRSVLPITVDQYHQLGQAGIIAEKTELVRGVILEKMIKSPRHTLIVQRLVDCLRSGVSEGFHVRQEQPLTFADSEPEPDVAVVVGSPDDYGQSHPTSAELVIEVAITTEDLDREKGELYAAAGVQEFWLVLPGQNTLEIHSEPATTGYSKTRRCRTSDVISFRRCPNQDVDLSLLFA